MVGNLAPLLRRGSSKQCQILDYIGAMFYGLRSASRGHATLDAWCRMLSRLEHGRSRT